MLCSSINVYQSLSKNEYSHENTRQNRGKIYFSSTELLSLCKTKQLMHLVRNLKTFNPPMCIQFMDICKIKMNNWSSYYLRLCQFSLYSSFYPDCCLDELDSILATETTMSLIIYSFTKFIICFWRHFLSIYMLN